VKVYLVSIFGRHCLWQSTQKCECCERLHMFIRFRCLFQQVCLVYKPAHCNAMCGMLCQIMRWCCYLRQFDTRIHAHGWNKSSMFVLSVGNWDYQRSHHGIALSQASKLHLPLFLPARQWHEHGKYFSPTHLRYPHSSHHLAHQT
jgi:hypothetical protein